MTANVHTKRAFNDSLNNGQLHWLRTDRIPWSSEGLNFIPIGVQKDWTGCPLEFRRAGRNAHWSSERLDWIPNWVQKDWTGYPLEFRRTRLDTHWSLEGLDWIPLGVQKDWTWYSLEFRRIGRHTHSLPACLRGKNWCSSFRAVFFRSAPSVAGWDTHSMTHKI